MRTRLDHPVLAFLLALTFSVFPLIIPNAAGFEITNITQTPVGPSFSWNSAGPGLDYTVQWRDSLSDGLWRTPADELWPIASTQWTDLRSANEPLRFYRVLAVPTAERGRLLTNVLASTMSRSQIALIFSVAGVPITPQYNVRLYKLVYETADPLGGRTWASGALALPEGVNRPLPLVSYQHGTITRTNEAPSTMTLGELVIGIALATTGYAAALPDYLGLGDSMGLHPYHHARSEATACVDMLRCVRTVCATNGFPLTNKLFLCGYSQGGHATMALQRELETFHTNEFSITASAPMAGAYDLSGVTTDDFLSGRPMPNPYYFAYFLAAYQSVYRFAATFADLLASPYNSTLPPLLNGNSSGSQINAAMPADPVEILKPELLVAFRNNPRHPLRLALEDNNVHQWRPGAPMRLYHCDGDQDVVFANSQAALSSLHNLGATQVQLINPMPSADHGDCVQPSLLLVKEWFDSLR